MEQLPVVRNFVILTALKIQHLMGELTEAKQLNAKLEEEHLQMKETELSQEIVINQLKEDYKELEVLQAHNKRAGVFGRLQSLNQNQRSSKDNLLKNSASTFHKGGNRFNAGNRLDDTPVHHNAASVWLKSYNKD